MSLASLLSLGVTVGDVPPANASQVLLATGWQYNGPVGSTKELSWTSVDPDDETPTSRLSLRPVHQRYDVMLKTSTADCVKQLRQELNARKLKPEPITCPDCEGQRYALPEGGTVSFYSKMKGLYPLVVVLHPAETPSVGAASPSADLPKP